MAENETQTSKPTTKAAPKTKAVSGQVVVATGTLDASNPLLLDKAADAFKEQVKETHGDVTVTSVAVNQHRVGKSVTYDVTGEIAG